MLFQQKVFLIPESTQVLNMQMCEKHHYTLDLFKVIDITRCNENVNYIIIH